MYAIASLKFEKSKVQLLFPNVKIKLEENKIAQKRHESRSALKLKVHLA